MEAISGLAINPADVVAVKRFAHASNTIGLIAPQAVILALTAFQEELKKPSQDFSINQQNTLMNTLLLELRHSLGIRGDKPEYFSFHLTNVVVNAKKSS
jgi:hypothetical protein